MSKRGIVAAMTAALGFGQAAPSPVMDAGLHEEMMKLAREESKPKRKRFFGRSGQSDASPRGRTRKKLRRKAQRLARRKNRGVCHG